jgi:RNA methyltransferase, TrmH family
MPTKVLRSRDNPAIKQLLGLVHSARDRKKSGLTVLDGAHLLDAFVATGGTPQAVFVRESAAQSADVQSLQKKLDRSIQQSPQQPVFRQSFELTLVDDRLLAEVSQLASPAAVMAIASTPEARAIATDASAVLVLDNVQDPGNVGAMLRCAAAFGITDVLLGAGTAFAWSPKVLRAAQGAHFSLNLVEGVSVAEFLSRYRGQSLALVPNDRGATELSQVSMRQAVALLVGNEGTGLSAEVMEAASARVCIPMPGTMESLNAASCGAIAMYELSRQRRTATSLKTP